MPTPPQRRSPRLRELGLRLGTLPAGPANAITDVPGVAVGHVTVWRDEPEPPAGRGVARTGVTAIVPADPASLFRQPLPAGVAVLNGAGELTGALAIREWGVLETPVYLTASMQVGRVLDGAVAAAIAADARSESRTSSCRSSESATTAGSTMHASCRWKRRTQAGRSRRRTRPSPKGASAPAPA